MRCCVVGTILELDGAGWGGQNAINGVHWGMVYAIVNAIHHPQPRIILRSPRPTMLPPHLQVTNTIYMCAMQVTYTIYMARRIPIPALRRIVRANFEPNEYPANMQAPCPLPHCPTLRHTASALFPISPSA